MSSELFDELKSKTKDEWATLVREKTTDARIWVQEHGEASLLVGVVLGLFIVLFFKLFVGVFVVGGLAALIVWQLAPTETSVEAVEPEATAEAEASKPSTGTSTNGGPDKKSKSKEEASEEVGKSDSA